MYSLKREYRERKGGGEGEEGKRREEKGYCLKEGRRGGGE